MPLLPGEVVRLHNCWVQPLLQCCPRPPAQHNDGMVLVCSVCAQEYIAPLWCQEYIAPQRCITGVGTAQACRCRCWYRHPLLTCPGCFAAASIALLACFSHLRSTDAGGRLCRFAMLMLPMPRYDMLTAAAWSGSRFLQKHKAAAPTAVSAGLACMAPTALPTPTNAETTSACEH